MTKKAKRQGYADPNDLEWVNRAAKRHADELSFRAMRSWMKTKSGKSIRVLSLPAHTWIWERSMLLAWGGHKFKFYGFERDPKVHKNMVKTSADVRCFFPCEATVDTKELFATPCKRAYDLIYLDWMGGWSKDKDEEIDNLLAWKYLAPGSLLRLTVSMARGCPRVWKNQLEDFDVDSFHIVDLRGGGGKALPNWKVYGLPAYLIRKMFLNGRLATLISAHVYMTYKSARGKGIPETSYLFYVR